MSTSNVPVIQWTPAGLVLPQETDILAGRFNDFNTAAGGNLRYDLRNVVGQLSQSETAIIGDKNDQIAKIVAGVDPLTSTGRMQDGIGRIYFMSRIAASPTVVTATCTGAFNVVIPTGARAKDQGGNIYVCLAGGTIPITGHIDLAFACSTYGPIAAPIGFVNSIYQAIPGWDTITNVAAGATGRNVETPQDFEFRRAASVAANAQGSLSSILGSVMAVPGVVDAYAIENGTSVTTGSAFTGSITASLLTVTAVSDGLIEVGHIIVGAQQGTKITALVTGTGGTGTYSVSIPQTLGSSSLTSAIGGVRLIGHSVYISAYGGVAQDIGHAIILKKSPGCNYNGNTTVTVTDDGGGLYTQPYPSYQVTFNTPTPTAIKIAVVAQNNGSIPSNGVDLIQDAVIKTFTGADGSKQARIGSTIFHSHFYAGIFALGTWAQLVYEIQVGVGTADNDSVVMQIDQIPTLAISDISVTFI